METPSEMRMKIVGKATEDADFRAHLLSDPKGTLEQELSVTLPASMSIEVHENRRSCLYRVRSGSPLRHGSGRAGPGRGCRAFAIHVPMKVWTDA